MKRQFLGVSGLAVAMLLAGCTSGAAAPVPSAPRAGAISQAPSDPFSELTDPSAERYLSAGLEPLLHVKGSGPHSYVIARPADDVRQIQFYVTCAPDSTFTLTMTGFFSGPCAKRFENFGAIPVLTGAGPLDVQLDVPKGVNYWLLAIPIH